MAFELQKWLHYHSAMLHYMYIAFRIIRLITYANFCLEWYPEFLLLISINLEQNILFLICTKYSKSGIFILRQNLTNSL
jgi:hypothetical protein